jgi:hypothetical protein
MKERHAQRRLGAIGERRAAAALAIIMSILLAGGGAASAGELWLGFHGGPSVPNLQGGTNEVSRGYTSRLGPCFGFFADYLLRPNLFLCAQINYSSEGGKRNGMQPITPDPSLPVPPGMTVYASFNNEAVLDYLEIPIMAKLQWGQTIRLFVDAGPYVGFLVRAKTVTEGASLLYDNSGAALPYPAQDFGADTDIKQDINSTNYGIAGGLGVEMPYGPGNIVLDAHFSYGLRNIQKDTELNGENNTGALVFTIGYGWPWSGRR